MGLFKKKKTTLEEIDQAIKMLEPVLRPLIQPRPHRAEFLCVTQIAKWDNLTGLEHGGRVPKLIRPGEIASVSDVLDGTLIEYGDGLGIIVEESFTAIAAALGVVAFRGAHHRERGDHER